jgi:hypothetical protein
LDRKTGQPVKNTAICLAIQLDYSKYPETYIEEILTIKTDEHGIFSIPKTDKNYYRYTVYNSELKCYFDLERNYDYNESSSTNWATDFFTDRAIYRPGQTVYFKAILYLKSKNKSEIAKNQKVKITLKIVNHETVSELTLTSNEYGSVFGEFILPQSGLTGNYYLESDFGYYQQKYFKVEEYKRPKFEVTMDTLKGEYVLKQKIITTGKAESYAGAAISDAKVVYRVERQEYSYYRWWYPRYQDGETITNGETKTDDSGKFEISFVAKPKNEGTNRIYTYTIYADVTDINGETHTAQTSLTIGDLPRKLELVLPANSLQKDFTKIGIKSTMLNGVTEYSVGKIIVTQLIAPYNRIVLPNKSAPERYGYFYETFDEQEFIKYFPHLPSLGVGSACVGVKAMRQPCYQAVRLDEIRDKSK